jgi:Transposase DDE domain group 1
MQTLALHDHDARRWEPKRLRLFSAAARLTRHARRTRLRFTAHWPWTTLIITALARLKPG